MRLKIADATLRANASCRPTLAPWTRSKSAANGASFQNSLATYWPSASVKNTNGHRAAV